VNCSRTGTHLQEKGKQERTKCPTNTSAGCSGGTTEGSRPSFQQVQEKKGESGGAAKKRGIVKQELGSSSRSIAKEAGDTRQVKGRRKKRVEKKE